MVGSAGTCQPAESGASWTPSMGQVMQMNTGSPEHRRSDTNIAKTAPACLRAPVRLSCPLIQRRCAAHRLNVRRASTLSIGQIIRCQQPGRVAHRARRLWLGIGHRCSCSAISSTRYTKPRPLAGRRRRSRSISICRSGSCRHVCAVHMQRGCVPTAIRLSQGLRGAIASMDSS